MNQSSPPGVRKYRTGLPPLLFEGTRSRRSAVLSSNLLQKERWLEDRPLESLGTLFFPLLELLDDLAFLLVFGRFLGGL
jgi:hypothetical protein